MEQTLQVVLGRRPGHVLGLDALSSSQINWTETLLIPFYASIASFVILCVHILASLILWKKESSDGTKASNDHTQRSGILRRVFDKLHNYMDGLGGPKTFSYMFARMAGCFALLALALYTLLSAHETVDFPATTWSKATISATYLYCALLWLTSILSHKYWSQVTRQHAKGVLLVTFAIYAYRDIWPLATNSGQPSDSADELLWIKLALLTVISVIIPLVAPRQYVPVDPKEPMSEPNPELTASWLSMMTFTFLDPIILTASKVSHLTPEMLPPLSDSDWANNLIKRTFPHLDAFQGARRHLFFRLMHPSVFGKDYFFLALALIIKVLAEFLAPTAIKQILFYLENDRPDTGIQPWVWIAFFFIGPMLESISNQRYIFIATRVHVRAMAVLTQLIFEHSLRIRVKAEASDKQGDGKDTAKDPDNAKKGGGHLAGKINNLLTTDLEQISDGRHFLMMVLMVPLQLVLCVVWLYQVLGWSSFVGLATIIALVPVPSYIAKKLQSVQKNKMQKSDARVQEVTESVGVIRMIKLFGWEGEVGRRIAEKREEELRWIWYVKTLHMFNGVLSFFVANATTLTTYFAYTVFMHEELNASKVFSSMAVFSMFSQQLGMTLYLISSTIQAKVSLDRLNDFLKETELLDEFTTDKFVLARPMSDTDVIGFKDATFLWQKGVDDGNLTPSSRDFRLRVDGELTFKRGCINLIVGPTGSGKTSMLMALLGEMHYAPSTVDSWFNLPRQEGVAYVPQESWVQNATIRENIVFGSSFDEERYKKVLRQCALEQDLELFEAGDETEIGERGLTLSGGQKVRVTLARAIYSSADIVLLDDVLAALDVHTSKWIIQECLRGDLIRGRTVILVTHNVALASPVADFVVSIGLDGNIMTSSTISDALQSDEVLEIETETEQELLKKAEEDIAPPNDKKPDGKLIIAEEVAQGHVSWPSMKMFLSGLGGEHPILFFTLWILGLLLTDWSQLLKLWFLGYWGSQYESHPGAEVNVYFFLGIYAAISLMIIVVYCSSYLYYVLATMRASLLIHNRLVNSVLGTTLRWLDETPTSRIITRCTQDIRAVDGPVADSWEIVVEIGLAVISKLVVVVMFTPIFLFPALGVAFMAMYAGNMYLKAQMAVKREMSNAKAPVLAHIGASIAGLPSVRAYSVQEAFKIESRKRIDQYSRVARVTYNLNRWIAVRIDALGAVFATSLAVYLVYRSSTSAANSGFSLNVAVQFSSFLLWWVRYYNDFEVQANSLERIQGYIDIEQEPKPTEAGKPPASWPTSGKLRVEGLSARYSKTGPRVLHDISFEVNSGERVGVVGRTGSGKSSLTLALLRCIITEGTTFYDGLPTSDINLDALRSHITIIPQMPELLSGTLRKNLDPFEQHDDATLNDALEDAGLFSLQSQGTSDEGRITLDTKIAGGGGNLSVGQRQIIALARAIIRQSKVLILDEATSAIDYETDAVIQKTLRSRLGQDVTVLTIAHRLQTIMDADKILVLDSGRIAEFDSPKKLLKKEGGKLKSLVDESGDREALYAMAEGKASTSSGNL
ncbi:hypothetical protein M422DRAFT_33000 [Sphaerobolus stellatus SS14]|uniref:P-loop containing nucleoside triphosphate hydrolase protein n=1 Tax=Sphaerobolus stellatus (strain SS14) TaxID=990650 RepID=A0A0C9UVR1_SPHS4|nr:hypothetical protein M422DRAFT_33000 [Sphaerobolus stellatus SS14]